MEFPENIGDGTCNGQEYLTEDCGWDGGDCDSCLELTGRDSLEELSGSLGDGVCNPDLNIMQCDWDWGDCNDLTCDLERIGDGSCDGQEYLTEACEWDGGDCDSCLNLTGWDSLEELSQNLGDGVCNPDLNITECSWDSGDCLEDYYNATDDYYVM